MGLDGFLAFAKKKYPGVIINEHVTLYSHQRVFMDVSSYIYKYISIFGNQNSRWLGCLLQMFLNLKSYKVHVVPVFDGKAPDEKKEELEDRKEKREKTKNKVNLLEQAVECYKNNSLSEEQRLLLKDTVKDLQAKGKSTKLKSLLFKIEESSSISDNDITDVENYIFSLKRTMFYMGSKEMERVKELLNILGIPYIQSPDEAEAQCSYLCRKGYGTAVISCDTDCFAHGCPNVVLSYEPSTGAVVVVKTEQLLKEMDINQIEFVDFAILIGCDYNKKTKIKNIGPVKGLELIKKYRCIENIKEHDFSKIEYNDIRRLFNKEYEVKMIKPHRDIDREALESFIDEHNLNTNINRLDKIINECNKEVEILFE